MESAMWSAIASFLLGGIGWLVVSFFAKPLLDFLNLRSRVHEELIVTGNIREMAADTLPYEKAVESLRRLGAKVLATKDTESRLLRWYLSWAGYDLAKAGNNLIGLSNSLTIPDHPLHTNSIEEGLQLPRTYIAEYLRTVVQQIQHPRS